MERGLAASKRQYLNLLGFQQEGEVVETVKNQIWAELEQAQRAEPPIKLASVARCFQIEPQPRCGEHLRDGELEFDEGSRVFRIYLGRDRWLGSSSYRLMRVMRARFTYAHEFAHRFFFVQAGSSWVRAIDVICRESPKAECGTVRVFLNAIEERLCNQIAGEILVPREHLSRRLVEVELRARASDLGEFHNVIRRLARDYEVSEECVMVLLSKAARRGIDQWPDDILVLVLEQSRRTGEGKKGILRERVKTAISEKKLTKGFYPWMPASKLGRDFQDFAGNLFRGGVAVGLRRNLVLRVREGVRSTEYSARTTGSEVLRSGRDGEGPRALVGLRIRRGKSGGER